MLYEELQQVQEIEAEEIESMNERELLLIDVITGRLYSLAKRGEVECEHTVYNEGDVDADKVMDYFTSQGIIARSEVAEEDEQRLTMWFNWDANHELRSKK